MAILDTNFLSQLSTKAWIELTRISNTKYFQNKELLYKPDTESSNIFIIKTGRIKIYELSDKGKETILWFCFPGEIFGLAELHKSINRRIYAESCGKTETLCVKARDFDIFLSHHHSISMYIIEILSHRLRLLAEMLLNISSDNVSTRLIKLLNNYAIHYGTQENNYYSLNIKLTHQEIGDIIGASRQTITSTMSQLQRTGLIEKRNGHIRILKETENNKVLAHEH